MNTEVITHSQRFPISGYLKLTKPSIIYLLVLTSATAMFLAEGFSGNLLKVVFGLLGIGLIASSSAAINQILDVEVDSKMARTKNRPLVKGEISVSSAKIFSGVLLITGSVILLVFINQLTLVLTLLTWAFYSFLYTKILKFAGTQNIVIGATGTVKGDIEFGNNLRTENGADIDGYIKKTNSSKSKLTGDFLFKKKDKKETPETEERPDVVNKEAIA